MSIEENGHRDGENGGVSSHEDSTAEHSFDDLTRGLATGTVPRRKALRMLAGALFGGAMFAAPAGMALAAPRENRKPGGTGCGQAGQIRNERGECVCNEGAGLQTCENNGACIDPRTCDQGRTVNLQTCRCECPNPTDVFCGGACRTACLEGFVLNENCECEQRILCQGCLSGAECFGGTSNTACGSAGGICVDCTQNTATGMTVCGPNGTCVAPTTPPPTTCTPACSGTTPACVGGKCVCTSTSCTGSQQCCTSGQDAGTCRPTTGSGCRA